MKDEAGAHTLLVPAPGRTVGSDPHDFAGLYIRHRTSFTSHARRYLRDPRDADEVVQEAFLRLFLALPELETELQALAYGRRTITNLCIDRYRSDARRPRLVALEGSPAEQLAEDDTGDPVVRAEDAALVREALSRLPALHRAALVKREIEEKSLPVIADELDVAEDSVKHLLFRARRALRKVLAGTSVVPGADAERNRGLRPAASGASGGLAGLLVLALLALGSGPDLRAVPVVGVDLPDVLGVTAVVDAVGDAVDGAVEALVPGERADAAAAPQPASRPAGQSAPLPTTDGPGRTATQQADPGTASTGAVTSSSSKGTGGQAVPSQGGTTIVTVVDGVPVVTVAGPVADLPGGDKVAAGVRTVPPPAAQRRPTGPAGVPAVASGAAVGAPKTPGRLDLPPGRPADAVAPGRAPRADDLGPGTGTVAPKGPERAAEKAEKAADEAAEKAVVRPPQSAARPQEQATAKAERAADKAAAKADRAADQRPAVAAQAPPAKADKTADKAAAKAADKAAKAAEQRAAAAAVNAAEQAAARAAERAAARQAAAKQAAAAHAVAKQAAAKQAAAKQAAAAQRAAAQASAAQAAASVPATAATAP